jgi:dTDP-4-amino-4,6-dideoxy-D-glucose acyltransferase
MNKNGFLNSDELKAIGFISIGNNVHIDSTARFYGASRISIGSNVRIDAYSVLSAGSEGISIGNHVHIGVYVFLTGAARIELNDFSGLSGRVSIYSSNDDYHGNALTGPTIPDEFRKVTNAPVIIGRHVVVGAGSVVLPGVTISEGACVGALSLVKKDVSAFSIIGGQKGQLIGQRKKDFLKLEQHLEVTIDEQGQTLILNFKSAERGQTPRCGPVSRPGHPRDRRSILRRRTGS